MTPTSDQPAITPRELTIIQDAAHGLSNKQIAAKYGVSKRTIDSHRANILQKTGCANMTEVVARFRHLLNVA